MPKIPCENIKLAIGSSGKSNIPWVCCSDVCSASLVSHGGSVNVFILIHIAILLCTQKWLQLQQLEQQNVEESYQPSFAKLVRGNRCDDRKGGAPNGEGEEETNQACHALKNVRTCRDETHMIVNPL